MLLAIFGSVLISIPVALAARSGLDLGSMVTVVVLLGLMMTLYILLADRLLRPRNGLPPGTSEDDVAALLRQGDKMQAIRLYRKIHGGRLKDARKRIREMAARSDH